MNLNILFLCVALHFITPSFSTSDIESDEADINVDINVEINQTQPIQKFRPYSCRSVVSNQARPIVILSNGLEVMCDTKTDGGGWTIFQRRFNGHLKFYRGWDEYKYGFGDLGKGEFYLGNEHIHRITVQARHELRIDLSILNRVKNGDNYIEYLVDFFARYARFCLYGEAEGYRLKIKGYSGNAGNALIYHEDAVFGTYDHNPREGQSLCAQNNKGAWWYQPNDQAFRKQKWKTLCHDSNLNGLWNNTELYKGMNWYDLTKFNEFVSFTEMKFREISK